MAFLAVHAHVSPAEFAAMDPADTRALEDAVGSIVDERDELHFQYAKLIASSRLVL